MKRPGISIVSIRQVAKCCLVVLWAFCTQVGSQVQKPAEFGTPGQIADVTCVSDSAQRYALYLPSSYTLSKRWPIIYFFDPAGRGRRPIELYKEIAEANGFILAGSNNSRNFSSDQAKAVNAIWDDTHTRLALDEHRVYASGFSGGARVAGAMALSSPGQVAGVVAHGAGYPTNRSGSKDGLVYFFAVGDQDFNWPEVVGIRRDREELGLSYRVRVFAGRHQWAPAEVMQEAVDYLNLKAMQGGTLGANTDFIERSFEKTQAEATAAEAKKDPSTQLSALRALVSDFAGIRDVKDPAAKLAALLQSPALKAAWKDEREQANEQFKIEQEVLQKISALADNSVPESTALRSEIRMQIGALNDQSKHAKNETKRLIAARAFSGIFVGAMEDGQRELADRHFEKAEACFDLMRQVTDDPWPVLLLADTHATQGNRKLALKDLQEAVRRGVKDRSVIENDLHLQGLRNDPDFQKLLGSLGN